MDDDLITGASSWPFQEARALLVHLARKGKVPGDMVTFQTGYGPSGAPHVGTFSEVVRTLWVMKAFRALTRDQYPTRLIMFSDDMDGLRKVPEGLPGWMANHLGEPLSSIPNPHGGPEGSFAQANNIQLIDMVDDLLASWDGSQLGSSPDRSAVSFVSATEYYKAGRFNAMLDRVWDHYDAIQAIMLPTLGEERRLTYSPFMPLYRGRFVLEGVERETIIPGRQVCWPTGEDVVTSVTSPTGNGRSKLQFKVDWAMRWVFFDVDYEMSGKDLRDSVRESGRICRVLGGTPPAGMTYELFLDAEGAKIAKSRGNGFSMEDWLACGSLQGLQTFLFQNPRSARAIQASLVPRFEDEFIRMSQRELTPSDAAWFFQAGSPGNRVPDVSYSLLLNLAIAIQSTTPGEILRYLGQSREITGEDRQWIERMARGVIAYAQRQGLYAHSRRSPSPRERAAFSDLAHRYSLMSEDDDPELFQYQAYEVGKAHGFQPLRAWFQALYECFLGSSDGPRWGAFTATYGLENTTRMLRGYEENGNDPA